MHCVTLPGVEPGVPELKVPCFIHLSYKVIFVDSPGFEPGQPGLQPGTLPSELRVQSLIQYVKELLVVWERLELSTFSISGRCSNH